MSLTRWLFLLALGVFGASFIRQYVVEGVEIVTGSMEPTLLVGHNLFVNKWIYHFHSPQRGDIVMFPDPDGKRELVKRVIAVEGDTIEFRQKKVFLNNQPLNENYVQYTRPNERLKGDTAAPQVVPKGFVFLVGDNRDESPTYLVSTRLIKGRLIHIK